MSTVGFPPPLRAEKLWSSACKKLGTMHPARPRTESDGQNLAKLATRRERVMVFRWFFGAGCGGWNPIWEGGMSQLYINPRGSKANHSAALDRGLAWYGVTPRECRKWIKMGDPQNTWKLLLCCFSLLVTMVLGRQWTWKLLRPTTCDLSWWVDVSWCEFTYNYDEMSGSWTLKSTTEDEQIFKQNADAKSDPNHGFLRCFTEIQVKHTLQHCLCHQVTSS